ncbi:hypothetical protein [Actinoplanes sp. NPDC051859]|uniref:hypothetical protein n=1 Tax=Actinoplanes sp. NPDC051859 TaxID=3363909 RepID=UPI00378C3295
MGRRSGPGLGRRVGQEPPRALRGPRTLARLGARPAPDRLRPFATGAGIRVAAAPA